MSIYTLETQPDDVTTTVVTSLKDKIRAADGLLVWVESPASLPSVWNLSSMAFAFANSKRVFVGSATGSIYDISSLWPLLGDVLDVSGCDSARDAEWLCAQILENDPNRVARGVAHCAGWKWVELLRLTESPIEKRLLVHVLEILSWGHEVAAQVPVDTDTGSYRLDIAVIVEVYDSATLADVGKKERIAIECDGHEFHERTKEQAQRDKARDRALTRAGWHVIRFTGSEIWKAPEKCADEISELAEKLWTDRRSNK